MNESTRIVLTSQLGSLIDGSIGKPNCHRKNRQLAREIYGVQRVKKAHHAKFSLLITKSIIANVKPLEGWKDTGHKTSVNGDGPHRSATRLPSYLGSRLHACAGLRLSTVHQALQHSNGGDTNHQVHKSTKDCGNIYPNPSDLTKNCTSIAPSGLI